MTANLPYGPMSTGNDYCRTISSDLFVRDTMLVVHMLGEEKPVLAL